MTDSKPDPNPYAPPLAMLEQQHAEMQKPYQVVLAVRMLWAYLAISVVRLYRSGLSLDAVVSNAVGITIVLGILVWIVAKISRGRNWARLLLVLFLALAIARIGRSIYRDPLFFGSFFRESLFSDTGIRWVIYVGQNLLLPIATGLICIGPGRHWFTRRE